MASPFEIDRDLDESILERAQQAAERWDARSQVRTARTLAVSEGRAIDADSRSRLAMRMNNLIDDVRRSSQNRRPPSNPVLKKLVERATPVVAEDLNSELVNEVVVGARDFLSIEFLERGLLAAKSVGRILIRTGGGLRPLGTGFLVGPGLLLTNEHVLRNDAVAAACAVEMDYEHSSVGPVKQPQTFVLQPERFFAVDAKLDFALVAVSERSDRGAELRSYGWLALHQAQGKIAVMGEDYLNIIQHPLGREKEIVLRENRVLDLRTGNEPNDDLIGPFIHYEADTEKGSSGSPVLNDQWDVVALHHSGVPMRDRNGNWLDKEGNIWRRNEQPVAQIQWVANEGVRVSSLVAAVANLQVDGDKRDLLNAFLAAKVAVPAAPAQPQAPPSRRRPADAEQERGSLPSRGEAEEALSDDRVGTRSGAKPATAPRTVSLDIPVRITVSIGDVDVVASAQPSERAGLSDLLVERLDPEDYADRAGYDRFFLGVEVPLPTIKRSPRFGRLLRIPRPSRPEDVHELRYHHYSVLMNARRRLAYVSACNIDFNAAATASRDQGSGSWRLDPRLDDQQLGNPYYQNNDYDKGHLTRRDDAAWGADDDEAIAANNDTFHYPNAAPQHYLLNQSNEFTGANLDLWGDLENFITEQGSAQRTRLSIFNGPVFGAKDKPLKDALAPLAFYKIVVWRDGDSAPGAIGFVLEQADLVRDLAEEAIDPGRFHIRQRRIAEIEKTLDISFGPVGDWDVLREGGAEEALDDPGILIRRVSDVRLA